MIPHTTATELQTFRTVVHQPFPDVYGELRAAGVRTNERPFLHSAFHHEMVMWVYETTFLPCVEAVHPFDEVDCTIHIYDYNDANPTDTVAEGNDPVTFQYSGRTIEALGHEAKVYWRKADSPTPDHMFEFTIEEF